HGAGLALGARHLAAARSGALQLRRLPRPHLQALARRQAPGRARPVGQAAEAIRLDPRDGLPLAQHALRCRAPELARAEARIADVAGAAKRGLLMRTRSSPSPACGRGRDPARKRREVRAAQRIGPSPAAATLRFAAPPSPAMRE